MDLSGQHQFEAMRLHNAQPNPPRAENGREKYAATHKIFVIGAPRTGTTSLSVFLNNNDLKTIHYFPNEISFDEESDYLSGYQRFKDFVENSGYTAFSDHPTRFFWRSLLKEYPSSKFILTVRRNIDTWLNSAKRYFSAIDGHHDIDSAAINYTSENYQIIAAFEEAGVPLLTIDIDEQSDSIGGILLDFLGLAADDEAFPKTNSENLDPSLARKDTKLIAVKTFARYDSFGIHHIIPFRGDATDESWLNKFQNQGNYAIITTPGIDNPKVAQKFRDLGLGYPAEFLNEKFWKDAIKAMPFLTRPAYYKWLESTFSGCGGHFGITTDIYRAVNYRKIDNWFSEIMENCVTLLLKPANIVDHAFSFMISRRTGQWDSSALASDVYEEDVNLKDVLLCLEEIIRQERYAQRWLLERQIDAPLTLCGSLQTGELNSQLQHICLASGNGLPKAFAIKDSLKPLFPPPALLVSSFHDRYPWIPELLKLRTL